MELQHTWQTRARAPRSIITKAWEQHRDCPLKHNHGSMMITSEVTTKRVPFLIDCAVCGPSLHDHTGCEWHIKYRAGSSVKLTPPEFAALRALRVLFCLAVHSSNTYKHVLPRSTAKILLYEPWSTHTDWGRQAHKNLWLWISKHHNPGNTFCTSLSLFTSTPYVEVQSALPMGVFIPGPLPFLSLTYQLNQSESDK